jgi:carboxymethylenebutenolidase
MYQGQIAEMITYAGHNGDEIDAYLARPSGDGPFGGVIFLHHAPAWDEVSIEMVRKLAHHGFATISPHLYTREGKGATNPEDAAAAGRALGGTPDDQFLGDADGALSYLRAQPYCNGRVAIIGGCSGGRQAYLAAAKLSVDAAIDCWGGSVVVAPEQLNAAHPVAPIDYTAEISCPVLGIFGADDYNPTLKQVEMTEAALEAHGRDFEFHIFEDAGHSFMTTDELNYRVNQSVAAWRRIFEFLDRTVG